MKKQTNKQEKPKTTKGQDLYLGVAITSIILGLVLVGSFGLVSYNKLTASEKSPAAASGLLSNVLKEVQPQEVSVGVSTVTVPQELEDSPKSNFKKITNIRLSSNRTIVLFGEIGENALVAAETINALSSGSKEPIYIVLSGPGGSVLTGNVLIAAMQASQAPIYTICSMMCASMDAMIHQYGKKRYVTDRTVMMFHPATAGTDGDVDRMYSMSKFLKRYTNKMEFEVAKRWGVSFETYKAKTQTNLWIDAEDSVQQKIADGIVSFSMDRFSFQNSNSPDDKSKTKKLSIAPDHNNPLNIKWICTGKCNVKGLTWLTTK
jgi:ATP-dependent Clp protease protease subunit